MNKLILVRGISGSGKSTYAKSLGIAHYEADMFFERNGSYEFDASKLSEAHAWCRIMTESELKAGNDVVVANTFTTMWEMMPYLKMGYPVEVVELTGNYGNIHNVPEHVIEAMKARWEAYVPIEENTIDEIDSCEVVDRKDLSVIAPILELIPMPGKDRIEFCKVLGYTGVVEKGLHQIGDLVLVTRYDSVCPEIPMFEFMRQFKFRVKTKKFNTLEGPVYSQVVIIPNKDIVAYADAATPSFVVCEGDDWTDIIGTKKWIPRIMGGGTSFGQMRSRGDFPSHVLSKTDEMNIQSKPRLLDELAGLPYRITLKCDGSSMTTLIHPDSNMFTVCSRNNMLQEVEGNKFWYAARKYDLERVHLENPSIGLQMELVGPGIQSNRMKLIDTEIRVFNVIHLDSRMRVSDDEAIAFCERYNLPMAIEICRGSYFDYSLETLIGMASRFYPNTTEQAEGMVVRPIVSTYSKILQGSLSFKVMNPEY